MCDDLSNSDAIRRLVSAVHCFQCPEIGNEKLSFELSLKSVAGPHPKSTSCLEKADAARLALSRALGGFRSGSSNRDTDSLSYPAIVGAAQDYLPLVRQICLSCDQQAETIKFDEKLVFDWTSGMEDLKKRKSWKSEAISYELTMVFVCEAVGNAGMGCNESFAGNYAIASKHFKVAAGQFECLANQQLPKLGSQGTHIGTHIPCEATLGSCEALKLLNLACAQKMAVATVLAKQDSPNYSLLAKLCLGIAEQLAQAISVLQSKSAAQSALVEAKFYSFVAFQTASQRLLSLYFLARSHWQQDEYGLAIGLLNEAVQSGKDLPDTGKRSLIHFLDADVKKLREHMKALLESWEKDNGSIYFDSVPRPVPQAKKLSKGMIMMKPEEYEVQDVEIIPLHKAKKKFVLW